MQVTAVHGPHIRASKIKKMKMKTSKGWAHSYLLCSFVQVTAVHGPHTRASNCGFHLIWGDSVAGRFNYFTKVQWNELTVKFLSVE